MKYISEVVDVRDLKDHCFNLVVASCGTGKTRWCIKTLPDQLEGVEPWEMVYVTSRSIIAEMVAHDPRATLIKTKEMGKLAYIHGEDPVEDEEGFEDEEIAKIQAAGISVLNYGQFIKAITTDRPTGEHYPFERTKVFIFDECHAIVSDTFIKGMSRLQDWLYYMTRFTEKLFIGLTATDDILMFNKELLGLNFNKINEKDIINYKAREMVCINYEDLIDYVNSGEVQGKSIIMCRSIHDCKDLAIQLRRAGIVVSRSSSDYIEASMEPVRWQIASTGTLPDYYCNVDQSTGEISEVPLDYLITTSTLREGFTLRADSGVRNVIVCYNDSLNITQFMGRCRFNIDKLIIAPKRFIPGKTFHNNPFYQDQEIQYQRYLCGESNQWYLNIKQLIDRDAPTVVTEKQKIRKQFSDRFYDTVGVGEYVMDKDDIRYWTEFARHSKYIEENETFTKLKNLIMKERPDLSFSKRNRNANGKQWVEWTVTRNELEEIPQEC